MDGTKAVESRVVAVTVFSDRAQVTREAGVELAEGRTSVRFEGLPSCIDPDDLRVGASKGAVLREVSARLAPAERAPEAELARLVDELRAVEDEAGSIQDATRRAKSERDFVERIAARITSAEAGKPGAIEFGPDNWIKMADFYRARLAALDEEARALGRRNMDSQAKLSAIKRRMEIAGGRSRMASYTVLVSLDAKEALAATVSLTYVARGPSWRPVYDLRVDSMKGTVAVAYDALVGQATGEDWGGVVLSLSTAPAHLPGNPPEIPARVVGILRPLPPPSVRRGIDATPSPMAMPGGTMACVGSGMTMAGDQEAPDLMAKVAEPEPAETESAAVDSGTASALFRVMGMVSVPSGGETKRVPVALVDFPAELSHTVVPALEARAYLRMKAVNASDYPFLAGKTRIFLDGAYVAAGSMETVQSKAPFEAALGVDEALEVEAPGAKRYEASAGIVNKRERLEYEEKAILRNRRQSPASVEVSFALPQSTSEDIAVRMTEPDVKKEPSAAPRDDGIIVRRLVMAPGEERTLFLKYSVEYPKGSRVVFSARS